MKEILIQPWVSGGDINRDVSDIEFDRSAAAGLVDAIADEVEHADYDVDELLTRRRGRPAMGSGPASVVPVRIDPELKAAIDARLAADHSSTSEVIREALRRFLEVA